MQSPSILTPAILASSLLAAPLLTAQCGETRSATQAAVATAHHGVDIVDTAIQAGKFKTLVAAVQAAGLEHTLRGEALFTVFAPTDAAFAKIPKHDLQALLKPENKSKLQEILKFHVVSGRFDAAHVVESGELQSVLGKPLPITTDDHGVQVAGVSIVKTDIEASNGIIHVVDTVLMPPSTPDIVDLAVGAGSFTTLVKAVQAAGLVETLKGKGPFTVLAPTDAAFAKLDPKLLASLLKPENKKKLQHVLKAHVLSGAVDARGAVQAGAAKALGGNEIAFSIVDGQLTAAGAKVVKTDLEAANGIVHVIDTVIVP